MPPRKPTPARGKTDRAAPKSSYRGADGMRRMQDEQKRQEAMREARKSRTYEPHRFYVPVGDTREIIIVDEEPDFFRNEHNLRNPSTKRFDLFTPCIDESANCPVCAASDKPAYFAMYLTVIDTTPFETRAGDEVEWSKKLLVVKPAQQKKIARLLEQHGTLRGMRLAMTRDGEKDAAIGNDIEFVEFVPEDELAEYVDEYTDKDGEVHEVIGDEPFDYEAIYPDMTEKQLKAIAGGAASVGNRDDDDRAIGRKRTSSRRGRDEEEEEEEEPRRRGPSRRSEAAPKARPSSRRARDEEPEEEEEEEEEEAPRSSRRTAGKTSTRPAAKTSRRTRDEEEEEEPEEEEEEEQEERRPRTASRRQAAESKPRTASRRARDEEPEEEEEEDDEPPFDEPTRRKPVSKPSAKGGAASRRDSIRNTRR